MADFTKTTNQSWFSRLAGAIKGIVAGIVIFLVSFVVLWQNEGCSVRQYRTISQGQKAVVSVEADTVDATNDKKLVHVSGMAATEDRVADPVFGIGATGIRLVRTVEMYQWQEEKKSETRKKLGGGEETVTEYTYVKKWSEQPISSSKFERPEGRSNPPMPYSSDRWEAKNVNVGAFNLNASLIGRIAGGRDLPVDDETLAKLPEVVRSRARIDGTGIYITAAGAPTVATADGPNIGDLKVSFKLVEPAIVSVIAQQNGNSFQAFQTTENAISELRMGSMSAEQIFGKMESENKARTWFLRLAGFVLMVVGIGLVFKPLAVLSDVIPILGDFVGMGITIIALMISLPLTLSTIALAWVFYRPLLGIPLFLVAAVLIGMLISKVLSRRKQRAAADEVDVAIA